MIGCLSHAQVFGQRRVEHPRYTVMVDNPNTALLLEKVPYDLDRYLTHGCTSPRKSQKIVGVLIPNYAPGGRH
jgi:hypothetical protein